MTPASLSKNTKWPPSHIFGLKNCISVFYLWLVFISNPIRSQIVINEVTNGVNNNEFVELVVECANPGGVRDIRNWIFDDNSGIANTCADGEGITCGHARFSWHPQWAAIPCGSIILIYNDAADALDLPADDPYDSNKDFLYVIPASNVDLLRSNSSTPGHPGEGTGCDLLCNTFEQPLDAGINWSGGDQISFENDLDLIQVLSPNGESKQIVAYGFSDLSLYPQALSFQGSGEEKSFQLKNYFGLDYFNQNNWEAADVSETTPGYSNSQENLEWIVSMQLGMGEKNRKFICDEDAELVTFRVEGEGYDFVEWTFGDPASGIDNLEIGTEVNHAFNLADPIETKTFLVTAKVHYPPFDQVIEKSMVIEVGPIGGDPNWEPFSVCVNSGTVALDNYISGTPGGVWSGEAVQDRMFVPNNIAIGEYELTYTVSVDSCERSLSHNVQVETSTDASWETARICNEEVAFDLESLISGTIGGTWSGPLINTVNQQIINPSDFAPGQYNLEYVVGAGNCENSFVNIIEISDELNPMTYDTTLCLSNPIFELNQLILGDAGGTWIGPQVKDNQFYTAGLFPGEYEVEYAVGLGGCERTSVAKIYVEESRNPSWADTTLCIQNQSIDLNMLVTGDLGGTFSGGDFIVDNEFIFGDLEHGSYEITYEVGPCRDSQTRLIWLIKDSSPSWEPQVICYSGEPIELSTLATEATGGFWSGTFNVENDIFDPAGLPPGSYSLTYTVGPYPCFHSESHDILVVVEADPTWETLQICESDEVFDLDQNVSGHAGGDWSGGAYVQDGLFNPAGLDNGFYEVVYIVGDLLCENSSTQLVEVISGGDASWNAEFVCQSDAPIDLYDWSLVPGGEWSGVELTDGHILDPGNFAPGIYELIYTVSTPLCETALTGMVEIGIEADASWTPTSICVNDTIDLNLLLTGFAGGTWSGDGVTKDGVFEGNGLPGAFEIEYLVGEGVCQNGEIQTVTVNGLPDVLWDNSTICEGEANLDLTTLILGANGGQWFDNQNALILDPTNYPASQLAVGNYALTYELEENGCSSALTQEIEVLAYPDPSWETLALCLDQLPFDLEALITGDKGGTFVGESVLGNLFNPENVNESFYEVTYQLQNEDCLTEEIQFIELIPLWQEDIVVSGVSPIALGESLQLEATGGINYLWTPSTGLSCDNCPDPIARPLSTTTYLVESIDQCSHFTTVTIEVDSQYQMDMPTAFSPNQDGINDTFGPVTRNVAEFEIRIFDRWGTEVFHSTDVNYTWDGTVKGAPAAVGVYVSLVQFQYYGETRKRTQQGSITLIR